MGKLLWYVSPRPPHSFPRAPFHPLPAAMNARLSLLAAAALSILSLAPARAADLTWTYTPNKNSTGAQTIDGITITPTYTWKVDESFGTSSGMIQIGKGGSNVVSIAYSFSAFPADIKSIAVTGKTASSNSGNTTVSATIGTDTCSGSASLTSAEGTITLAPTEGTQSGNLSILISNPNASDDKNNKSSQAVYLRSIVVTYKDPNSAGLTQLGAPVVTPSNVDYFQFSFSWTDISGATGYDVVVKDTNGAPINTVTVDGTAATVTDLEEGTTYQVSVVAKGDGTTTDDSDAATLSVTTATAPAVFKPDPEVTAISASSFTLSWSAQNDASFSVCAWTNIPTNASSQNFAGYAANGTVPEEWIFKNSHEHYPNSNAPVDFKADGNWIASPEFGGPVESVSFYVAAAGSVTNSHFFVYGTTGTTNREDWVLLNEVTDSEKGTVTTEQKTLSVSPSAGIKRIIFEYQKNQGNVRIGTFSVTGTDVGEAPVYLPGYGPSPTDVNTTSVTFADPVVGETYYVEVTATGLSGRTETEKVSVTIPAASRPAVISVK